ncbi:MAG TPA: M23 family metallopeptidase [Candidatus Acidoferrales bacterium]|jgi:hypothetical protein|nr:M23 family metallopeptidase [Candidatus Acidoferrales bacterium]
MKIISRIAAACIAALSVFAITSIQGPHEVRAGTVGNFSNSDVYESGNYVSSGWYGNTSQQVTQRYGCTNINLIYPNAEEPANPSICDFSNGFKWWHQGMDIGVGLGTGLSSPVSGTVADSSPPPCNLTGAPLGYLGIRTDGGNIIYLLHGCLTSGFFYNASNPATVHIGDSIYTTGTNGNSTGSHLHFEVHISLTGGLYNNPGPGDDINPEGWLVPGLTAQSAMGAMAVTDTSGNEAFYAFAPRPVDGHLSLNFYSTGSGWILLDESSPSVSANPPPVALSARLPRSASWTAEECTDSTRLSQG